MGKGSRGEFVVSWLLALYWVHIVHSLSSDGFSADATSRIIGPFLEWLLPEASEATRYLVHKGIRKLAHLTEYAILAGFAFRAISLSTPGKPESAATFAALLALAVAVVDESTQAGLATRTGSSFDVALDFAGGSIALWLLTGAKRDPASLPACLRTLAGDA